MTPAAGISEKLRAEVEAWIADDPDPVTRTDLRERLDAGDAEGLGARFSGLLRFGTAGLRAEVGAGPSRMNRAVVRRAAAAVARWLEEEAIDGPVVVGRDARHGSWAFAADTVAVLRGQGRDVAAFETTVPTPLLAFAARDVAAAAGVMVTASHNPPADNGYKVYGPGGSQIVPPVDGAIAARMEAVVTVTDLPLGRAEPDESLLAGLRDRYLDGIAALRVAPTAPALVTAYTPMHGVGGPTLLAAFERSGLAGPVVVERQFEPDPDFPTVSFPNPEEPGAMDLVLELGVAVGADLVLANDPDADRLAVAVPVPGARAGWRVLTGDEVGVLLADHLLRHGSGADRLVVTTVVSSSLLARIAETYGVEHVETLTGFKWLAKAASDRPHLRPVLAYEEALGYCPGDLVADKDGISSAVVMADLAGELKSAGSSVLERLDELALAHGLHATRQRTWRFTGADASARMAAAVARLRSGPPRHLGPLTVTGFEDLALGERLPPTDAVVLRGDLGRVVVRPSGTEPKLKAYAEVVLPATTATLPLVRTEASGLLDEVLGALDPT